MTAITPVSLTTATTTATMVVPALNKATSIPVRAIPVPNTNKLILAGPCIVLRTATVAEQVQALRQQEKKAAATANANNNATNGATTVKTEPPQTPELLRCKRRADLGKLGFPEAKPLSVSRRNARERNRVKLVNQGFDVLREHVPNGKKNRKMSKVDTLKSAVEYIRQMQEMIREHDQKLGLSPADDTNGNMVDENCENCGDNAVVLSVSDSECEENASVLCGDAMTSSVGTATTDNSVVSLPSEAMIIDSINNNNNNNNNKFVNFNTDNNNDVNNFQQQMDTMNSEQQTVQHTLVQQVNSLNNAQQVNSLNNLQQLSGLESLNTSTFIEASPFVTPTSSSAVMAVSSPHGVTPNGPAITLITLPVQHALSTSPASSSDDVFLTEPQQRLLTAGSLGAMATLTTLQGVGSLSGQRLTITQPCRRHLSFSDPDPQVQDRLEEMASAEPLPQQQQQQQQRQPQQQLLSFTLLAASQNAAELGQLNGNTLTLAPHHIPTDQQQLQQQQPQQQQQQQQQPEPLQFTTLSNMVSVPDQSASSAMSVDQSATSNALPLTDTHGYTTNTHTHPNPNHPNHHHHHLPAQQGLVAPSNVAVVRPQLQVEQAPSPSFSTSSSHTSESSYESYESLGSLEEDLQDLSNWITEICKTAHAQCQGEGDDGTDIFAHYPDEVL